MDDRTTEFLLDNEREWRRYMIRKVDDMSREIAKLKARSLVVEVIGGALFAILLALVQIK